LGFIYAEGKGVQQDYVTASMWFNLAAAQGVKLTTKEVSDLSKVMTQEQVKKAQDLARECFARKYQGC
jgi:TPR repeat protein